MKRLVLILICVLLCTCARADFDAETTQTGDKSVRLMVQYVNDTSATVSGAEVWLDGTRVLEVPDVKPGAIWTATYDIAEWKGSANVSLVYAAQSETVSLPGDYSGIKMYIQLPERALVKGETVKARITLVNGGKTDVRNAVIKTSSGFESDAFTLAAGGYISFETDVKVTFPLKLTAQALHAGVEFAKAEAGDAVEAQKSVNVSCVVASEVKAGEAIPVTVNIENTGNVDYSAPVLSERNAGIISGLPEVLKAGDFVTVNVSLPALYQDSELVFTLEGLAECGGTDSYMSTAVPVTVTGSAEDVEGRSLVSEQAGETSFVAEALLGIATLNGLPFIAVCACAAVSVLLLVYMIVRSVRRSGKHRKKA